MPRQSKGYGVRGRPPGHTPAKFPNRLREIRNRRGLSQDQVAENAKNSISQQTIGKLERGDLRLKDYQIEMLARALNVDPGEIVSPPRALVPVVGYIGAGSQVFPIDDYPTGASMDEVICPAGLDPARMIAVIVRGDSMLPMGDGWVLFYSRVHEVSPADLVGQLCAVKIANDGPLMVKQVRRAPTPGRFNLVSSNSPLIEDAEIEWAAKIESALPPVG